MFDWNSYGNVLVVFVVIAAIILALLMYQIISMESAVSQYTPESFIAHVRGRHPELAAVQQH
jgi:hypothetical protein